jgi:lipopolysaccharide export system ATP-binding protein
MSGLLQIDSVLKSFAGQQLLTDIYLHCETGEIVGILGRNGSGKSTLLRILFGLETAELKHIRIDGKVYDAPYKTPGLVAYLPQQPFLPKNLTTERISTFVINDKNSAIFWDDVMLKSVKDQKISELSGGELRYFEIKLLLNSNVKFVLLDEPFSGLAPMVTNAIKDLIRETKKDKGIIITDHDYRNVLDVATRTTLLFDGGLKPMSSIEDLATWGYIPESSATR